MDAHLYWRIALSRSVNDNTRLESIQFRTSIGGAQAAVGGTASASRTWIGSADSAFAGGSWGPGASGVSNNWIQYQFASATLVAQVAFTVGFADNLINSANLLWSDNGVAFFPAAPVLDTGTLGAKVYAVGDVTYRAASKDSRLPDRWPSGPVKYRPFQTHARYDSADSGAYRVAGTVAIDGAPAVPVVRRVRLFDVTTGRFIRQVWSAADGTFAFEKIRQGEYLVVSDDYTRTYNAVVADRVSAVP